MNKNSIAKIWETHLKKKVKKGSASLLKISFWGSSVSAYANESPGFSVSGGSTPNGLFQTINDLKDYWVTPNGSINNLELFVNY